MTCPQVGVDSDPAVLPRPPCLEGGFSSAQRAQLLQVCARPELGRLAADIRFSMGSGLELPFVSRGTIVIGPEVLQETRCAAVTVRHALELAQWQRNCGEHYDSALGIAVGLLACRASALVAPRFSSQPADSDGVPEWLAQLYCVLSEPTVSCAELQAIATRYARELLQLQGLSAQIAAGDITCQWPRIAEYFERHRWNCC
jgi:hypothetical protein